LRIAEMPVQKIKIGAAPNDKTGDSLREAFALTNSAIDQVNANTDAIAGKVDKAAGMGLSQNSFTNDLLAKLNGIEAGATNAAAFGIGALTAPLITDIDGLRRGGVWRTTAAVMLAAGGPNVDCVIFHLPGGTSNSGHRQIAYPITSSVTYIGRGYSRAQWGGAWQPWHETAMVSKSNTWTQAQTFNAAVDLNSALTAANGIKLAGTLSTDVNTLDRYEEGTFTPTLLGTTGAGTNTYNINTGQYTRIGDRVLWTAFIQLSSSSGMTGQLRMAGLPFNVINNSVARGSVTIGYYAGMSDTAAYDFRAFHNQNAATVDLLKRSVGQVTSGAFPATEVAGTAQIYLSGNYKAA
jgi:hypothetical protein